MFPEHVSARVLSALVFVLVLGATIGIIVEGARLAGAEPLVIRASRFQLVDAEGKLRGEWGLLDSSAELLIYDTNGIPRIRLACNENPGVFILNGDAKPVITVAHNRDNGAFIYLRSDDKRKGLSARVGNDVGPYFGLVMDDIARAGMQRRDDDVWEVFLKDAKSNPIWTEVMNPPAVKDPKEAK